MLNVWVDGIQVSELGPGAVVGERALLEGGRRTATLRAVTGCIIAVAGKDQIDRDSLASLAHQHHREDSGKGTGREAGPVRGAGRLLAAGNPAVAGGYCWGY